MTSRAIAAAIHKQGFRVLLVDTNPANVSPSPEETQRLCRAFATEQIALQMADFKRLGVLGDWDRPYRTMDFVNEAQEIRAFKRVVGSPPGAVRRARPVGSIAA